jgi:hypothetical protein
MISYQFSVISFQFTVTVFIRHCETASGFIGTFILHPKKKILHRNAVAMLICEPVNDKIGQPGHRVV